MLLGASFSGRIGTEIPRPPSFASFPFQQRQQQRKAENVKYSVLRKERKGERERGRQSKGKESRAGNGCPKNAQVRYMCGAASIRIEVVT